jgi:hypothetical protein
MFVYVKSCFMAHNVTILQRVPWVDEKSVYSTAVGWNVLVKFIKST